MNLPERRRYGFRGILAILVLSWLWHGLPAMAADDAANLREKYRSLAQQLDDNRFGRPLFLESTESQSTLEGDIYAVLDYPFATVNSALNDPVQGPANWCDVLILHLNTKYCRASTDDDGPMLDVRIGRKIEQALEDAHPVQFRYRATATRPDHFQVELAADTGPLGTRDYRIVVDAVAVNGERTFLHLHYSYSYGIAARVAMATYLATAGRNKVGFSTTDGPSSPESELIGGVRGAVERNTMRYYLAIDAYLGAFPSPADERLDRRLTAWFDATEQYAPQLREVSRNDYMQMKYNEYQRQQAGR